MDVKLTWDTLGNLDDGRAGAIINAALASAIADVEDRGQDEKPREVTIKIQLAKIDKILAVEVQAGAKLPTYRTDRTACAIRFEHTKRGPQPVLFFQEYAPDNAEQDTLDKHLPRDRDQ